MATVLSASYQQKFSLCPRNVRLYYYPDLFSISICKVYDAEKDSLLSERVSFYESLTHGNITPLTLDTHGDSGEDIDAFGACGFQLCSERASGCTAVSTSCHQVELDLRKHPECKMRHMEK